MQRGDDDAPPGLRRCRPSVVDDREVEAALAEQLAQPRRRTRRRRRRRRRGSCSASSSREAVGQPVAVADDRAPPDACDDRRVGALRRRVDRPRTLPAVGEQPVGLGVQARERASGSRAHVDASARARSSSSASRSSARSRIRRGSTSTTLAVVGQHVGEQRRSSSTSHGSQLSMPSKRAPSASRSHCSRPHGSLGDQLRGAGADRRRSGSARGPGRSRTSSRSSVLRWSLTLNVGEPVDLVAPQVDADRARRRSTGRRRRSRRVARPRRGARPAPRGGSRTRPACDERVGIDDRRSGGRRIGSTSIAPGPRRCSSARTPATIDGRGSARGRAAATAPRGGGPSSRRSG